MIPPRLRILCAYHDEEPSYQEVDPQDEFEEHEVTTVGVYEEVKTLVLDERRGVPPFDIVLIDIQLPGGIFEGKFDADLLPTPLLQPYFDYKLIRGIGIFVPSDFESHYEISDGFAVTVASKECWTPVGTRDWRKLLHLVLKASDEADRFNIRE